jgi:hypothetical protein
VFDGGRERRSEIKVKQKRSMEGGGGDLELQSNEGFDVDK